MNARGQGQQAGPAKGGIAPLAAIARREVLAAAFARVARGGGAAGGDGVTVARFALDAGRYLAELAEDLRAGCYRPGRHRRHGIPKANGGTRVLSVPCVRDRIVQSALAQALDRAFDATMDPASFAYRRGLSVQHAAAEVLLHRLRGHVWVVDGDIENFFDSVPHDRLIAMLDTLGVCPRSIALVRLWLHAHAPHGAGLAQGSPLSPVLSNLYLSPFDRAARTRRTRLVRYADDFLLMARSLAEAERARDRARKALAALGLTLNPAKTRIAHLDDGIVFLGLAIKGERIAPA